MPSTITTGDNNTYLGSSTDSVSNYDSSIALGAGAFIGRVTMVIADSFASDYYVDDIYVNGVTGSSPKSFTLNAAGASGTNIAGANLTLAGGKGTGNAVGGDILTSSGGGATKFTNRK